MEPYLGLNVFLQEKVLSFSKKNRQNCPKLGVSLKNYLRFLQGLPNMKILEVGS